MNAAVKSTAYGLALVACGGLLAACARQAPGVIEASGAWTRATPPDRAEAAVYASLRNPGGAQDRLVSVQADVAGDAQLHESRTDSAGVMSMRRIAEVELPAGAAVELAPLGLHIMLVGLKAPLAEGQSFPLVLRFERAAPLTVQVSVRALTAAAPADVAAHPEAHQEQHEHHE